MTSWVVAAGLFVVAAVAVCLIAFGIKKLRSGSRAGLIMVLFGLCLGVQVFMYVMLRVQK
jgi:hypothetical protein